MKKKRVMSEEGRRRIGEAQRARWAKLHKNKKLAKYMQEAMSPQGIKQIPALCTRDKLIISLAQTGMSSTVIAAILQTYDESI